MKMDTPRAKAAAIKCVRAALMVFTNFSSGRVDAVPPHRNDNTAEDARRPEEEGANDVVPSSRLGRVVADANESKERMKVNQATRDFMIGQGSEQRTDPFSSSIFTNAETRS